jgi:hypothetical protein
MVVYELCTHQDIPLVQQFPNARFVQFRLKVHDIDTGKVYRTHCVSAPQCVGSELWKHKFSSVLDRVEASLMDMFWMVLRGLQKRTYHLGGLCE